MTVLISGNVYVCQGLTVVSFVMAMRWLRARARFHDRLRVQPSPYVHGNSQGCLAVTASLLLSPLPLSSIQCSVFK